MRPLLLGVLALALLVPAPAAAAPLPGVQAHLLWRDVDRREVRRQAAAAAAVGAAVLRVDVSWAALQPRGPRHWDRRELARLDMAVDAAHRRGLRLLPMVWRSPCWASSAPARERRGCRGAWWERDVELHAPRDPRDLARALAVLAARHGDRVAAWELWNEPNSRAFFRARDPVRAYAGLLRAAHPAVRRAAPGVPLLGGALMYADAAWTRAALRAGAAGAFDGWSVHPYSGDRSPGWSAVPQYSFLAGVPEVRRVLLEHGQDVPLWLTEVGWHTGSRRGGPAWENGVDEATQARYVEEALGTAARWPWVAAVVLYSLKDRPGPPAHGIARFGLLRDDLRPKPAAEAFRRAARALAAGTMP